MRDGRELYFEEAAQSLDAAKARAQVPAEVWPDGYVIYDEATGERVLFTEPRQHRENVSGTELSPPGCVRISSAVRGWRRREMC